MSLLTRCPACTTLYRVVPDQLRISEGWVKCGQCAEIFDASQNLIQAALESDEPSSDTAPDPVSMPVDEPSGALASSAVAAVPDQAEDESEAESGFEPEPEQKPDLISVFQHDLDPSLEPDAALLIAASSDLKVLNPPCSDSMDDPSGAVPELATPDDPPESQDQKEKATESGVDYESVSFLKAAKPLSFWSNRVMPALLVLVSIVLGLGLLAQGVYQQRDHLAAIRPDWRPVLQTFCVPMNCSVSALQRIESITIESAAFNQLGADSYRLRFAVRNQASLGLARPSIELTLTDFQEQIVIRRVLSPTELLTPFETLAAGSEWPVAVSLQVNSESMPRIVGYRLLAFYP